MNDKQDKEHEAMVAFLAKSRNEGVNLPLVVAVLIFVGICLVVLRAVN